MEEDIKILEEFIKIKINSYALQFVNIPYPKLQQAIEHLISSYKKLEEENKELKSENYELNNRINDLLASVPKSVIEEKIKEIEKYRDLTRELITERIVVADSNSLYYGRAEAHDKDITVLQELLEKGNK